MTGTWVPAGVDITKPSAARVYDCLLGGGHNFPADRHVADFIVTRLPWAREIAGSNRAFLRRAVLFMAEQGITRYLDLGSGIPTVGNVHEIAQRAYPDSRVVYVDYEPVAVAHSELLLSDNDRAAVVRADLTDADGVLSADAVRDLFDTGEPIGLLMVAVHHFVPDEKDPAALVARYRDALPPGSHVAISHLTADHDPDGMAAVTRSMADGPDPMYFRTFDRVAELFDGMDLVEPGLVDAPRWRPEPGITGAGLVRGVYAGVARVRGGAAGPG
ncbi:SAM-dependent methyltransferase [Saccharothrix sp. NRRL B-16314]|uniref:SAM-dependent methyltransferase n=1 Tax=Saccharothrix sp. NRRL B-16314 TaxID=1463825 RepID=UPI000527014F|nr:SAM-dependent methyltransferase [Saccharothrix sp. NRRL B-16314]